MDIFCYKFNQYCTIPVSGDEVSNLDCFVFHLQSSGGTTDANNATANGAEKVYK